MGATGALRVAATTKLSFVDVSPSTVAELNERAATCGTSVDSTPASIGASVATNASIVAIAGWIMPDPLATPVIVIGTPSTSTRRDAPLGTVSVVMIADTAASQRSGASAASAAGSAATIFATGSGSMITPVERGSTSFSAQPRRSATALHVVRASAMPACPVPALALPALNTIARRLRAAPAARCSRQTVTGAAQKRFAVNTPAACVPASKATSSTSSRGQSLMRAAAGPSVTPGTGRRSAAAGGV
jgi:hypothetical protein